MRKLMMILAGISVLAACKGFEVPQMPFMPNNPETGEEGVEDTEKKDDDNAEDTNPGNFGTTVTVTWDGASASVDNMNVLPVSISGGHVVLGKSDSNVEGVKIILRGTGTDGSIKFYNQLKTEVCFEGVNLCSSKGPAFNCQSHKHIYMVLSDGSVNVLKDAATYVDIPSDEDAKACIFSEGQLVFEGGGSLSVVAQGGHGIASDDYVRIKGGDISVKSVKDGIHANEYFRMDDGSLTIEAESDGVEVDEGHITITGGNIDINAVDDGMVTSYEGTDSNVSPYIDIEAGKINIVTSGADAKGIKSRNFISIGKEDGSGPQLDVATSGATITKGGGFPGGGGGFPGGGGGFPGGDTGSSESAKAIKAFGSITINGGDINVATAKNGAEGIESKSTIAGAITVNGGNIWLKCYDDCINTSGSIIFNGGNVFAWATNNDAIDSNYGRADAIVINGGTVIAHGTSSPEEGLDCDNNSWINIKAGTLLSTGGQQSSSGTPVHSQGYSLVSTSVSTGWFTVVDNNGRVVLCCYVPRSLSQSYCMLSSPDLKAGSSYKCGILSTPPEGSTATWGTWRYDGGTASVSTRTFTAQ